MKALFTILLLTLSFQAQAEHHKFLKVSGAEALKDQHINQYSDDEETYEAFDITLPPGYRLVAADVNSGGTTVCSVTHVDSKAQRLTIEALVIETDEGGCEVTLSIFREQDQQTIQSKYSIEQTGT